MNRIVGRLIFVLVFFCTTDTLWASFPASGTITASQSCEAYVSKNKRTNPDNTKLEKGQGYQIFEVNKTDNSSWYRIRISAANPSERWVAGYCGTIHAASDNEENSGEEDGGRVDECRTPGLEDGYVLALSWQPAFCETHRDKPECRVEDKKSYQARNFTLHGLWPNKKSCATHYGFCGEVQDKPGDFCDYPELQLFTETRQDLEQVMPSAAAGSCLQRHEWFKHGTCQSSWSIDEYYEMAIDLTRQFNESGISYFMSRNIGKSVSEAAFTRKVDCLQGSGAHQRIELKCKDGNLVDVYINLPSVIEKGAGLGELMLQEEGDFKSNCGGSFSIDSIGFQ
ncbi:MAG: hypothetical protein KQH63_14950 [Desulfobulbaceae bacterium]|nr:hypothetical protein [Desulfobulbaceae bacterium]